MGKAAENFVDFLAKAGQKVWQVLPLVPTGYGDSPYASSCATAGSPYLIDVEKLEREGLVTKAECAQYTCETGGRVDYEALFYKRIPLLRLAFSRFDKTREDFRAQFIGISEAPSVTKDGGSIEALTGATVTSRAVSKAVALALEFVKEVQP